MKMSDKEEKMNIIKVKGMLYRILFPRPASNLGKDEDSPFGITIWDVLKVEEGKLENDWGQRRITVKGNFYAPINDSKTYLILAKEVTDEKYGLQYELLNLVEDLELNTDFQKKSFLRSILTENQLKEMFKTYPDPMPYIKNHDVEALSQIKGVGDYIANCIINRYEENKDNSIIYIKLADMGLTPNFIQKLIKKYQNPEKIVDVVKNHPYRLTYDIDGIGFKTADKIALKGGLSPTSVERLSAFIKYHLEEIKEDGFGYLTARELMTDIYNEFEGRENIYEDIVDEDGNVVNNNINMSLQSLQDKAIITIEENINKGQRRVYLTSYYNLEKEIARHLIRIKGAGNRFEYGNWMENIKKQEEIQGFSFTQEQLDGIKLGLDSQICFITGLAGTGKSTLVSGILASLGKYSFKQCALSGKAASRLQEVTGKDGCTIHRLLEYNPACGFGRNENNLLMDDIIILDELSLVGEDIFNCLLRAIPSGTKLVLLGDMGQLESIGEGNLAYDIYNSGIIPVIELTKVQRQAQKSGIITMAHEVREQNAFFENDFEGKQTYGELKDMHFDVSSSYDDDKEKCMNYFRRLFNSIIVKKDIMELQLIAPVKERGDTCVFNLNTEAQEIFNPKSEENERETIIVKVSKDKSFEIRKNDKVMCVKNNYKTVNLNGENTPIFNGWTGIVKHIDCDGNVIIDFPLAGVPVIVTKDKVKSELVLGYACTCHKYQGSGSAAIIGVINYSTPPNMLTSQLLYTLMTRAKKQCVIVGQNKAINQAIRTNFVSEKRTFLPELLIQES